MSSEHDGALDTGGAVGASASWEGVKVHATTRKQFVESNISLEQVYAVAAKHGWQTIMDIMGWKDAERVRRLSDALVASGLDPLPDNGERRAPREVTDKRLALCKTCERRPKKKGKQRCEWCWLLAQPIEDQIKAAEVRLSLAVGEHRARVPKDEWPPGERWCAGCQSFIPDIYVSGSRCKACESKASHSSRLKATYGITREEFEALFEFQGGKCYMCHRTARSRRLAVDHDHKTGEVRGLLCADPERGCNHSILGNITGIEMARRIVDYLEEPPARRLFGQMVGRIEPERSITVNDNGDEVYDPFA